MDNIQQDDLFDFESYKAFLEELNSLKREHYWATINRGGHGKVANLTRKILLDLPLIYRSRLPTYLLAYCPICGGQVTEPIDTFSLSGIGWWISESRGFGWFGRRLKRVHETIYPLISERFIEPSYKAECKHVQAVCYGVNLNGIIPNDIKPLSYVVIGSERPGLLKTFMDQPGSCAVIHTLPVGRLDDSAWQPRYTAYIITYVNKNPGVYLQSLAPQDPYSRRDFFWPYELMDYDLLSWLETDQLFWLDTEVEGYPLRQEPMSDFPYAEMKGVTGRWTAHPEKGAELLPQLNDTRLYTSIRNNFSSKLKPIEEKALRERKFRHLNR